MATAAARKTATGEHAINAAMAAGFEITRHAPNPRRGTYFHELTHADGRALTIDIELGTDRFVGAQGWSRSRWNTTRLAVRSLPALRRLLDA